MPQTPGTYINVLYQTDDNYAVFGGVSMYSLFVNNQDIDSITVYVIDDNISKKNKAKMEETAKTFGRTVIFMNLDFAIDILEGLGLPKYRGSYAPYLRLFAFDLLPDTVKRVLFLDCDTIVTNNISQLFDIDMNGCMIGAVRDGISQQNKTALGFAYDDSWFNSGVMLVDVDAWKDGNAQKKILALLKKRQNFMCLDQDLLNITQYGNIMTLHPRYNLAPHFLVYSTDSYLKAFPQGGFYEDLVVFEEAKRNPSICHFQRFLGSFAWDADSLHPYAPLFDEYLRQSPWKDYEKQPRKQDSVVMKAELVLYKILPPDIFIHMLSFALKRHFSSILKGLSVGTVDNVN